MSTDLVATGKLQTNTQEIRNIRNNYGKLQSSTNLENTHSKDGPCNVVVANYKHEETTRRRSSILHEQAWQKLMAQLFDSQTSPPKVKKQTSSSRRNVRRNVSWEDTHSSKIQPVARTHSSKIQPVARRNVSMDCISSASLVLDADLLRPSATLEGEHGAPAGLASTGGESKKQAQRGSASATCAAGAAQAVVGALRRAFKCG